MWKSMKMSQEWLELAKKLRDEPEREIMLQAIEYSIFVVWTVRDFVRIYPWHAAHLVRCGLVPPALKENIPEIVEEIARAHPSAAIEDLLPLLSKDTLAECVRNAPYWAEKHARRYPADAIRFMAEFFPDEFLVRCARRAPKAALMNADKLRSDVLCAAACKRPDIALRYASDKLPESVLAWCAEQCPDVALEHAE